MTGIDRRNFIKACAGVGAAGALAAAGFGIARPISDVPVEVVPITYPAIKVLEGSPAPYGLPLIPLRVEDDGRLVGIPDAAEDQLKWYKYCSHERAPGTEPSFESDNELSYFVTEEKIAKGFDAWYKDFVGEPVNVNDFPDGEPLEKFSQFPGVGAAFKWRSNGVDPEDTITGIVVRVDTSELPVDAIQFDGRRIPEAEAEQIRNDWFPQDPNNPDVRYIAFCSFCTHFCCVPGFHEGDLAISSGFGGTVFCSCHLSRYDPFVITKYDRTIFVFPEPGEGEEGGDQGGGGGH